VRIHKQQFRFIFRGGLIFTLLLFGFSGCDDTSKKKLNHAAALGWREFVQTDLDMSEFYGNNFTLAARFMVQYPKAYVGPIMAASGGGLEISKQDDATTLAARFGNTTATYASVNLQAGKWHHLALVRNNNSLQLFFDGQQTCPSGLANCSVAVGNVAPSGTLRLGRPGTNPLSGTVESQHYGFIDDVAVFKVALSQNQIQSLINAPRLLGNEANLFAGWTFDTGTPSGGNLPQKLTRPVVYQTITSSSTIVSQFPHTALVSQTRDNAFDEKLMKFPNNQVSLALPFPKGEVWTVGQGWQGTISHSGRAAFAWDFNLPSGSTKDKPYFAAAVGPVIDLKDDRNCCGCGWPADHIDIQHAPDEIGVYLHHVKDTAAVSLNQNVGVGAKLANAGDTGNTGCGSYHLHFSIHNKTESNPNTLVTIPATFENYEVSTDNGGSWSLIKKGVPKQGEWIRNP
jgi:Concanavalin A-like lectin/glucanases superfamily/Peptidase family M23